MIDILSNSLGDHKPCRSELNCAITLLIVHVILYVSLRFPNYCQLDVAEPMAYHQRYIYQAHKHTVIHFDYLQCLVGSANTRFKNLWKRPSITIMVIMLR